MEGSIPSSAKNEKRGEVELAVYAVIFWGGGEGTFLAFAFPVQQGRETVKG